MSLQTLAEFAARSNYVQKNTTKRLWELTVEEARAKVTVRDGNRKPSEDGSQALVLGLGRHTLPLDKIAEGSTRVNAPADQVEAFTAALVEAVNAGQFDEEIAAAQAAAKESAEQRAQGAATKAEEPVEEAAENVDGLDLDSI